MKRLLALALCAMMAFGLCACGDSAASGGGAAGDAGAAATGDAAEAAAPAVDESLIAPDGINVCIASEPDNIDPALNSAVDGATLILHTFAGLAKWEQAEDGSFVIAPDCAEELVEGEVNEKDGTVKYTYTLKDPSASVKVVATDPYGNTYTCTSIVSTDCWYPAYMKYGNVN